MKWKPAAERQALALRARLLETARRFFSDRGVMEVQTPVLVSSSCPDPNIPSIVARPSHSDPMYLHTSPEHAMKRLLCAGSGDIYQICPVFRDGEAGRYHNPEFTMIEWYRIGYSHLRVADETVALIQQLLAVCGRPNAPTEQISYHEAFMRYAGIDPHTADAGELAKVCESSGVEVPDSVAEDRDALLDLLLGVVVAANFAPERFYVLHDYPATQAALEC
ncbi:MAG: EF-P lysine aminoacylase GenX, partial [Gammaproteobacteria bacterium]|nr:EF-P lysine aminoacylase GenX [Gammaproteobacteria bacterium]